MKKPTVVVCEWLTELDRYSLTPADMGGIVPPKILRAILAKIEDLAARRRSQGNSPSETEVVSDGANNDADEDDSANDI